MSPTENRDLGLEQQCLFSRATTNKCKPRRFCTTQFFSRNCAVKFQGEKEVLKEEERRGPPTYSLPVYRCLVFLICARLLPFQQRPTHGFPPGYCRNESVRRRKERKEKRRKEKREEEVGRKRREDLHLHRKAGGK